MSHLPLRALCIVWSLLHLREIGGVEWAGARKARQGRPRVKIPLFCHLPSSSACLDSHIPSIYLTFYSFYLSLLGDRGSKAGKIFVGTYKLYDKIPPATLKIWHICDKHKSSRHQMLGTEKAERNFTIVTTADWYSNSASYSGKGLFLTWSLNDQTFFGPHSWVRLKVSRGRGGGTG